MLLPNKRENDKNTNFLFISYSAHVRMCVYVLVRKFSFSAVKFLILQSLKISDSFFSDTSTTASKNCVEIISFFSMLQNDFTQAE